jgi:hypothetical protein
MKVSFLYFDPTKCPKKAAKNWQKVGGLKLTIGQPFLCSNAFIKSTKTSMALIGVGL